MKLRLSHIILPLIGGLIAWGLHAEISWLSLRLPLLTVLSVVAAGLLVRLSRGIPFSDSLVPDIDDARQLGLAIQKAVRAVRATLAIVFATMLLLVFLEPGHDVVAYVFSLAAFSNPSGTAEALGSGLLGCQLTYVVVRLFVIVNGDVGLVDLQAKFLIKKAGRDQLKRFDDKPMTGQEVSNPSGYGRIVEH
ncbi:hypothetical protein [Roseicyclus marinus]|uniref:hypothetical protein n=1 Tax=Roseicyclus marinus TaxID=2161673 RepID=UPI00240FF06A|nr:hypothetical protein [Roseicyclus marinus]MDG3040424.1 hypothetical protein [Roseicyclus marinus]